MNKEVFKLLKSNVGKSASFYIGSTYMTNKWYILPFTNDELLRVVSLDSDNEAWINDPDTVITDTTFTPKGKMSFSITHFRIDQLIGITIFSK
jgi:hypothetical protein